MTNNKQFKLSVDLIVTAKNYREAMELLNSKMSGDDKVLRTEINTVLQKISMYVGPETGKADFWERVW